jgi:hypothetical protein
LGALLDLPRVQGVFIKRTFISAPARWIEA